MFGKDEILTIYFIYVFLVIYYSEIIIRVLKRKICLQSATKLFLFSDIQYFIMLQMPLQMCCR